LASPETAAQAPNTFTVFVSQRRLLGYSFASNPTKSISLLKLSRLPANKEKSTLTCKQQRNSF
jgi:hypothetical protein